MNMDRAEFTRRLERINVDHAADIARVIAASKNGTTLENMWAAAEQKYVDAMLALQREAGIPTPVAMGRTE